MSKRYLSINEVEKLLREEEEANDPAKNQQLVDELAELVDKERTQSSAILVDQGKQINQWKKKYDELVVNVLKYNDNAKLLSYVADAIDDSDDSLSNHDELYEDIDDNDNQEQPHFVSKITLDDRVLNLSNMQLNEEILQVVNRLLFSSNKALPIDTLIMKKCELDDSCISLLDIVGHSFLKVIDLSFNYLSLPFQKILVSIYQNYRKTPECLFLHGNQPDVYGPIVSEEDIANYPGVSFNQPISVFIDSMTDKTWAVSLTLPDFNNNSLYSESKKKSSDSDAIYDMSSREMNCLKFLQYFNKCLSGPSPMTSKKPLGRSKSPTLTKRKSGSATIDPFLAMRGGLRSINSLGLTHAQMSKATIKELKTTLRLTYPTLTDLDLSYCFIGFDGALVLREILSDSKSNLVRLNVTGNDIRNAGFEEIVKALKDNRTLTSLNCQTNCITNKGIDYFVSQMKSKPNNILCDLNVIGNNDITMNTALATQIAREEYGLLCAIRWPKHIHECVILPSERYSWPTDPRALYEYPFRVNSLVNGYGEAMLYSIDLRHIYSMSNSAMMFEPLTLHFQWKFKPSKLDKDHHETISLLKSLRIPPNSSAQKNSQSKDQQPLLAMREQLKWEIRFVSNNGDIAYKKHKSFALPAIYSSIDPFDETEKQWLEISTSIRINYKSRSFDLPTDGRIEIYAINNYYYEANLNYLSFDSIGLKISSTTTDQSIILAGDSRRFSSVELASISVDSLATWMGSLQNIDLPDKHSIVRAIQWIFSPSGRRDNMESSHWRKGRCMFTAQLKLAPTTVYFKVKQRSYQNKLNEFTQANVSELSTKTSNKKPSFAESIGYRWTVFVHSIYDYSSSAIAQGSCSPHLIDSQDDNDQDMDNPLKAWIWNEIVVDVSDLQAGDFIVLTGEVFSNSQSISQSQIDECELIASNCYLLSYPYPNERSESKDDTDDYYDYYDGAFGANPMLGYTTIEQEDIEDLISLNSNPYRDNSKDSASP